MTKRFHTDKKLIDLNVFKSLLIQVGSIKKVSKLVNARKQSYEMDGSLSSFGVKKSCGQFVRNYKEIDLLEKKVSCYN
jgi:hypothetical protein